MSWWSKNKDRPAPHPEPSDDALLLHHLIGQLGEVTADLTETAMILRDQVKAPAQDDKGGNAGAQRRASGSC